jgi:K+-sensing histidine kinase KdpD
MIVHDMRSPLQVIFGSLQLAQENQSPKCAANFIEYALESTNDLILMVSTLLDVSKMEEGKMTLELSAVDMKALV